MSKTAKHELAIAKPTTPGAPYIITCTCGLLAEAHFPTAALVAAYHHDGLDNAGNSIGR